MCALPICRRRYPAQISYPPPTHRQQAQVGPHELATVIRRAWPAQTRHLRQIALAGLRTWCLWACEHDPTIASTYPTLLPDRTKSLFRRRPACNPGLVSKRAMTRVSELAREGSQMPFRERRAGFLSEFSYRYPWRLLEQRHPLATLATSKHGQIGDDDVDRSEEHTSELQSLMRISYAV